MPDAIEWHPSTVAFYADGALHPFVTPQDLLRFRPLPPLARVRLGAVVLAIQLFARDPAPFEDVTARAWITRWMGRSAWDGLWGPLLRGKFGARADDIAMVWLWSKLRLRRSVRGEDGQGGAARLPARLVGAAVRRRCARRSRRAAVRVHVDRPAREVIRDGDGFSVRAGAPGSFRTGHDPHAFAPAGEERYDRVLATVPGDVFAGLLAPALAAEVGEEYLGRVRGIEYHAALCLLLELDRQFSPYYWTNVGDTSLPFVGLIEQTNMFGPEHYGGRRLLYVANYLEHGHELLGLDADALLDRYVPGLRAVNPAFDRSWVSAARRFVEPAAQPIVTPGYARRIPPLRTPAPGLVLANTTQVYPEDRGTNYAVRLGEQAAHATIAS